MLDIQETVFRFSAPKITLLYQWRNQAGFESHPIFHSVVTKAFFRAVNWSDLKSTAPSHPQPRFITSGTELYLHIRTYLHGAQKGTSLLLIPKISVFHTSPKKKTFTESYCLYTSDLSTSWCILCGLRVPQAIQASREMVNPGWPRREPTRLCFAVSQSRRRENCSVWKIMINHSSLAHRLITKLVFGVPV